MTDSNEKTEASGARKGIFEVAVMDGSIKHMVPLETYERERARAERAEA